MSGGIYDGHRGGYSSSFDTYSTWKNNTKGLYNEYRIDGSWMDDGDYDKAFKGYPSNKTVNIFMGGVYQEPSWKTTLLSGGIGLGLTALGMWAMGLFGGRKAKPEQPSTALNLGVSSGYWNSYFNNWQLPSLFGNQTPTNTPATNTNNNNNNNNQTVQNTSAAAPGDNSTPATTKADGLALNKTLTRNVAIQGDVTKIGRNNTEGYPESFVVTDTNNKTDPTKPNVYTYKFESMSNEKPIYRIESIKYFCKDEDFSKIAISLNSYRIDNDAVKKGKEGEAGKIEGQIKMLTESNKPAMSNHSLTGQGTERFYPPKK